MAAQHKTFTRLHARLEKIGKPSQEWRYDNPKAVAFGYLMGNDLWLPIPGIEPQANLIEWRQSKLCIRVTKDHEGHIVIGNQTLPLSTWRNQKTTFEKNGFFLLPLEPKVSLVLTYGPFHLHLWISQPPKNEKARSFLPKLQNLFSSIPKLFIAMIAISSLFHFGLLELMKIFPPLHTVMPTPLDKDFRKISIADVAKMDKKLQEQLEKAASMGIKIGEKKASRPQQPIDASGYIQAIVSKEPTNKSGSFSSLFTTQSFTKDLGKALSGKSFGDVMSAQMKSLGNNAFVSPPAGGQLYEAPTGQALGTSGVKINLGVSSGTPTPSGSTATTQGTGEGSLDQDSIRKVFNSKRGELDACYDAALFNQRDLRGKATLFFKVLESGRTSEARIETDSLQNKAFQSCLLQKVAGWSFPKPTGGSVSVKLPLLFSPSSGN